MRSYEQFPRKSFRMRTYKKHRGWGGRSSHPGAHHSPIITRHFTQVLSFHTLAHSFALFCTFLPHQKLNSFVFRRFRTLYQKHGGGGRVTMLFLSRNFNLRGPRFSHFSKVAARRYPHSLSHYLLTSFPR